MPDSAAGISAELNGHQMELVENVAETKYEAIDEVTRAYLILGRGTRREIRGDFAAAPASS